ncbi:MAG TPA: threonine/serine dehydratase [Candidatus Limnocylindria bacterium]|nr:threonine/serine dehydratase [Candidatus Limnocylindria bacterium]
MLVPLSRIQFAAEQIRGVAVRTPLLPWDEGVWLKPESLQPVGAFKMRGASFRLSTLTDEERAAGVITYSSGNHAQAVARAARLHGVHAVIVMPEDAPALKVERVKADGAELILAAPGNDARRALAEQLAVERRLTLVPPYDDPEIIAGQGTCGLEIAEDLPEVGDVLVPVSGGGLISGIAVAIKALVPGARVIGVEPEDAADARESMTAGEIRTWPTERTHHTIADGLRVNRVGDLPWAHIQALVDDIVTVSDAAMRDAIRELTLRARLVVEPSGAASMAAHLTGAAGPVPGSRVIVLSGGNIDPQMYRSILSEDSASH